MKVKDIIETHKDVSFSKSFPKVKIMVKPKGKNITYYSSDCQYWGHDIKVAEMDVLNWFIVHARKNNCEIVILVNQDKEYEDIKYKHFKELCDSKLK